MYRLFLFFLSLILIYFGVHMMSEHLSSGSMASFSDKEYIIGILLIAAGLFNFLNIIDG